MSARRVPTAAAGSAEQVAGPVPGVQTRGRKRMIGKHTEEDVRPPPPFTQRGDECSFASS